jgi:ribosome-associated translation inhibitor RaiA
MDWICLTLLIGPRENICFVHNSRSFLRLLLDFLSFLSSGTNRKILIINSSTVNQEKIMQIQINSDHHIQVHEAFEKKIISVIEIALGRISDHITRVEVHLSDENGDKSGENDKRCVIEARLEGRKPIAVTYHSVTVDKAVDGAADKLTRMIESILGRQQDQMSRRTDVPLPKPELVKE